MEKNAEEHISLMFLRLPRDLFDYSNDLRIEGNTLQMVLKLSLPLFLFFSFMSQSSSSNLLTSSLASQAIGHINYFQTVNL